MQDLWHQPSRSPQNTVKTNTQNNKNTTSLLFCPSEVRSPRGRPLFLYFRFYKTGTKVVAGLHTFLEAFGKNQLPGSFRLLAKCSYLWLLRLRCLFSSWLSDTVSPLLPSGLSPVAWGVTTSNPSVSLQRLLYNCLNSFPIVAVRNTAHLVA